MPTILSDQQAPPKPVIVIGLPTFGTVSMKWHVQTHDMLTLGKPMNRICLEKVVIGSRVDEARNLIVNEALELRGTERMRTSHVFFVDDDVLIERDTLIRLLAHDVPIVSGLYYAKTPTPQPLLFLDAHAGPCVDYPKDQLVPCHGHGMGCTLIKREVFDAIEPPWFLTEEGRLVGTDFISHTEDIYFLDKARAAGFQPMVDTAVKALHYDAKTGLTFPTDLYEVPIEATA